MIVVAKLEMSDFEQALDMKVVDWAIFQAASEGLEYGRPKLRDVRFTFFDSKLIPYFFEWAKSGNSKRSGKIHYISSDMAKVEYCFSFKDAVCSGCYVHFIANEELPLYCDVSLSVSLEKQDLVKGKGEKAKKIVPAPIEGESKAPKLVNYFITDTSGNKLDGYEPGDLILLHIKTENRIGDKLTVNLNDKSHDFKHNGVRLENDILNYTINNDLEQVELEVIDQQN